MNKQKVALVTGSSRGIGREIALGLAKKGYAVVINYHKNESEAVSAASSLQELGTEVLIIKADIGDPSEVGKMSQQIEARFGRLDLLVNNAGIILRPSSWNEISDDHLLTTVKVNLLGPMYTIRELTPLLIKGGGGNIINISSTYAYNGAAAVLAYTASKAGVMSITKAMALELAKHQIRVNGIAPGNIDTDMTNSSGQGVIDWVISTTPLKRLGNAEEISHCVNFLLDAEFITGHIIDIDGGQILTI